MTTLISSVADVPAGEDQRTTWQVDTPLQSGSWYYWRAIAVDGRGVVQPHLSREM